ncbi:DUF1045 domain-containing protein [Deinococcus pimensis]|uniref:DUF1045 domain-containing protein n=1 Tax=Deinococcus pimensis TaxID=309888 RepID=UPI0004B6B8E1|nr:DUF1045 domain-containing protein [Deinococcus pimensis]
MTTRFAVYLVPPAQSAFFRLGSAVLGWDSRAGQPVQQPPGLRPEWTAKAGPFGFHLTVTEAFECDPADWDDIERELRALCACLSPDAHLALSGGRTEVWDGGEVIVLRYEASEALVVLQTLLVARLARFVTGSSFDDLVREDPSKYAAPHERARLRALRTPRGLDTWTPHFTLVEPYEGEDAEALASDLEARFEGFGTLDFDRVTLMRQEDDGPYRAVLDVVVGRERDVTPGKA